MSNFQFKRGLHETFKVLLLHEKVFTKIEHEYKVYGRRTCNLVRPITKTIRVQTLPSYYNKEICDTDVLVIAILEKVNGPIQLDVVSLLLDTYIKY